MDDRAHPMPLPFLVGPATVLGLDVPPRRGIGDSGPSPTDVVEQGLVVPINPIQLVFQGGVSGGSNLLDLRPQRCLEVAEHALDEPRNWQRRRARDRLPPLRLGLRDGRRGLASLGDVRRERQTAAQVIHLGIRESLANLCPRSQNDARGEAAGPMAGQLETRITNFPGPDRERQRRTLWRREQRRNDVTGIEAGAAAANRLDQAGHEGAAHDCHFRPVVQLQGVDGEGDPDRRSSVEVPFIAPGNRELVEIVLEWLEDASGQLRVVSQEAEYPRIGGRNPFARHARIGSASMRTSSIGRRSA
jgi:hypothetical protein